MELVDTISTSTPSPRVPILDEDMFPSPPEDIYSGEIALRKNKSPTLWPGQATPLFLAYRRLATSPSISSRTLRFSFTYVTIDEAGGTTNETLLDGGRHERALLLFVIRVEREPP